MMPKKASMLVPSNENYKLVVATCMMRLEQLASAAATIREVIKLNPKNESALFHEAFCHRLDGRYREAIDNLTKILSLRENMKTKKKSEGEILFNILSDDGNNHIINAPGRLLNDFESTIQLEDEVYSIPTYVIYETRGILFHQGKAFKLALSDLGRAILLNPENSTTYFLRADCYSKLGNYEKAVENLLTAEDKDFEDMFSLLNCRGTVWRSLGNSEQAEIDFRNALTLLGYHETADQKIETTQSFTNNFNNTSTIYENSCRNRQEEFGSYSFSDKVEIHSHIRALSLHALSLYDLRRYAEAYVELKEALMILRRLSQASKIASPTSLVQSSTKMNGVNLSFPYANDRFASRKREKDGLSGRSKLSISDRNRMNEINDHNLNWMSYDEFTSIAAKKLEWTVSYHIAGCLHNLSRFEESSVYLQHILQKISNCFPDEFAVGVALFFYGIQCNVTGQWLAAEESFCSCLRTLWAINSTRNMSLCRFALGKALQGQKKHVEAVKEFSEVINKELKDAHAYFRRAWSHKAIRLYHEAASDFETAKALKPNDPNFSIIYKKVQNVEYVALDSEPDLMEKFPTLLEKI